REVPAALVGLTAANQLVSIPSDSPASASGFPNPAVSPPPSPTPITGLAAGERVVGIDFRPRTGQLYALAVSADGTGTAGLLLTQGGVNQVPSPNSGLLLTVGPLGVPIDPNGFVGFDVQANASAAQGPAFAVFDGDTTAGVAVGLYSINLATGAATPL